MPHVPLLLALLLSASPCPNGTVAKGAAPPRGTRVWCENAAGQRHGPETEWYAGGQKKSEGSWLEGEMDGAWRSWREDGALWLDESFVRGEPVSAAPAVGASAPPASPLPPAPAPATLDATKLLLDPAKHPRAPELRRYVAALSEHERREMTEVSLGLVDALERLNKVSAGTTERRTEGRRVIAISRRPAFAGRIIIDLELQLIVEQGADRSTRRCQEQVSYPDPTGRSSKMISEPRSIDCALLASDPDLGSMARGERSGRLPWSFPASGQGPATMPKLTEIAGLAKPDFDELQARSKGEVRYGAVVLRFASHGGYSDVINTVAFTTDQKRGGCAALLRQLDAELGANNRTPPKNERGPVWTLEDRKVTFRPTEGFEYPSDREAGRCDVVIFLRPAGPPGRAR